MSENSKTDVGRTLGVRVRDWFNGGDPDGRAKLRQWMRENGFEAHDDRLGREPMDHVAAMLSLLGWLARERPELLETYLGRHLLPWVFRYLDCLEESAQQPFYQGLAGLTRLTLAGAAGDLGVTAQRRTLFW